MHCGERDERSFTNFARDVDVLTGGDAIGQVRKGLSSTPAAAREEEEL